MFSRKKAHKSQRLTKKIKAARAALNPLPSSPIPDSQSRFFALFASFCGNSLLNFRFSLLAFSLFPSRPLRPLREALHLTLS